MVDTDVENASTTKVSIVSEQKMNDRVEIRSQHSGLNEEFSGKTLEMKHQFPCLADVMKKNEVSIYHGSRNLFENYDHTKEIATGRALYGRGQYFYLEDNKNKAREYALLTDDEKYIPDGDVYRDEIIDKKIFYEGSMNTTDMRHIILPDKLTDAHYDMLIGIAEAGGNENIAKELKEIKAVSSDRYINLYQWLRNKENVEFMQSIGINGIYDEKRGILAVYNTSNLGVKINEAVVLEGTAISENLISDKTVLMVCDRRGAGANIVSISGEELMEMSTNGNIDITKGFVDVRLTEQLGQENKLKKIEEEAKISEHKMNDRVEARVPHKAVSKETVEKATDVAKKRKGFIDKAIDASRRFNDSVDNKIEEVIINGSTLLNNTSVGKIYQKVEKAVLDTKIVKGTKSLWGIFTKTIGDSAIAQGVKKVGTKIGGKVAAKVGGKSAVKCAVKKIPIISAVAGTGFAVERCFKGEWVAAGGEFLSGVAGCFPGLGTAASVAIDVGLATNDISKALNKENKADNEREQILTDAKKQKNIKEVQKQIAERTEALRREGRIESNKGKSKVNITKITQEMILDKSEKRA